MVKPLVILFIAISYTNFVYGTSGKITEGEAVDTTYTEDEDLECEPEEPQSCNGDPNAISKECGNNNCGRLCSNYNKQVACLEVCQDGCNCKPEYVFDENIQKCVLPSQCTPVCKKDEVYSSCTNTGCVPQNCTQLGFPVPCKRIDPKYCIKGCICARDNLRAKNGTCVPKNQCDTPCGGDPNSVPGCGNHCGRRCSEKNNSKHGNACSLVCSINGCDCKTGYLYDDATGKCVLPEKCSITCGKNEVYSTCVFPNCNFESCSDKGKVYHCPIQKTSDCVGKCVCKKGHLRDENGVCVPEDTCPSLCDGDPNAIQNNCGDNNCGRLCSNYNKGIVCAAVCHDGCSCKSGYVFDENIQKCVLPKQCTPVCKKDEEYNSCTNSGCVPQNCTQLGFPVPCVRIDPKYCKKGCVCAGNKLRSKNGTCVPREKCGDSCGGDKNAVPGCGGNCGRLCSNRNNNEPIACTLECNLNGCDCKKGYLYDEGTGKCVLPQNCSVTCSKNEIYSSCVYPNCLFESCSDKGKIHFCPLQKDCVGKCICKKGYFRHKDGVCIAEDTCPPPQNCKSDEVYNSCINNGCVAENCTQLGFPLSCARMAEGSCIGGCMCQEGKLRAKDGTCVLKKQCDSPCGGDPNAVSGCGGNCGRYCSDLNSKVKVACRKICDTNGCDCKKGYWYDEVSGKCVLPEQCPSPCGLNEVSSKCINSYCGPEYCSDLGKNFTCVSPPECFSGCICKPNHLRDRNGVCIPKNTCPTTCNGDPNALPGCGINCGRQCYDYNSNKKLFCNDICSLDGCDCKEGYYYDNVIKKCVLPEQCSPSSCNGDINAVPGCGVNCGRQCSTYNSTEPQYCPTICYVDGCDCKKGFVFDDIVQKCVEPEQCTPEITCDINKNEIYSECINYGCAARECSQVGNYSNCNPNDKIKCEKGCVCKKGYLRAPNGICVPKSTCDGPCKGDENAKPGCGNHCGNSCATYKIAAVILCAQVCYDDGCDCKPGYVYDENTSKCVFPEQCTPICKANEVYKSCINNGCDPRSCDDLGNAAPCQQFDEGSKCVGGCVCQDGYLYNTKGVCVPREECDACGGDPNATPGCGGNCGRLCSNYNASDAIVCPLICRNINGCDCRPGYVYDGSKCVLPEQCPSPCGSNEVFSTCIEAECRPQTCSEKDVNIPCISDNSICSRGCICKPGYYRNRAGACIPKNKCPTSCNGDPNALPGCGVNCGKQCSGSLICPRICYPDGCDCKSGYLYDHNLKKCVKPDQCTESPPKTCGINEEYSECINGICRALDCKQKGNSIPCPDVIDGSCIKGCVCKENYLKSQNGTCVPENECDVCPNGGYYSTCPPEPCDAEYCPQSRDDPLTCRSNKKCGTPRCICGFNSHRDRISGKCIPTADCPPFPCKGKHEVYDSCPPVCPGQNCSDYLSNSTCPKFGRIGIVVACKPQCRCKKGHYRSNSGACISAKKCKRDCKVNEVFSECTNGGCDPRNCTQLGKPVPCVKLDPAACIRGCVCQNGYLRNTDGLCVPKDKCDQPIVCGEHEVVSSCTNGGCTKRNCSQINEPALCIDPIPGGCIKGCVCEPNYLRNSKGKCVLERDCPGNKCKKQNEYYERCINANDPQTCASIGKPITTYPFEANTACFGGCRCKNGFYRNESGDCVPASECPPNCGDDEVYSDCVNGGCDKRNCTQYNSPQICIDPIRDACIKGCVCKPGLLKNREGKCVRSDKCPESKCVKQNEFYDYCPSPNDPQTCESIATDKYTQSNKKNTVCVGKCRCKPGFRRNKIGDCISVENCLKCTGPNEYYSCGGACDNVCATLKKQSQKNCPIINIKCNEMCYCEENYARDENKTCIPIKDCKPPVICGTNEEYSDCTNGLCRAQNCTQKGKPIACPLLIEGACEEGCVCKQNFLRGENGTCISENDCNVCPDREIYSTCPPKPCDAEYCPLSRDDPLTCGSNEKCGSPRCTCGFNSHRDRTSGQCIPTADCPPFPCNGPHETYESCPPVCPGQNCSDYINNSTCSRFRIGIVVPCKPQCRCQKGYYRNEAGVCVLAKKCVKNPPELCGINEEYSNCTNGLCRAQNCTQKGLPVACPKLAEGACKKGCVCKQNYLKGKNGTCIPENDCDVCPIGEIYSTCPPKPCDAEYCPLSRDDPLTCGSNEKCGSPRCTCGFNSHRDRTSGKCIPTADCPPFPCNGPHETYESCPPVCPGQNCSDYINNSTCSRFRIGIVVPCKPQCRCQKGYYRNEAGVCVLAKKCVKNPPELCGINEEYSNCTNGLCRAQNCTQKGLPVAYPKLAEGACKKGCVCKQNYLKGKNGTCIPENDCDVCPDGEIYSTCPPKHCDAEYCPLSRDDPLTCGSNEKCGSPRCTCGFNSHRDRTSGKCIPTADCPPFPCNGPHETYESCPPVCPGQNCSDYINNSTCSRFRIGIVVPCKPQCRCQKGYYRNEAGVCVLAKKCVKNPPELCGINEEYSNCTNGLCRAQNCTQKGLPVACPELAEGACKKGCVCKNNYLRGINGTCVSKNNCDVCREDEVYSTCPPAACDADYCPLSNNAPQACASTKECKPPRCVCPYNYRRDRDTQKCIHIRDCPSFDCNGKNEIYDSCPIPCPGDSCAAKPTPCPLYKNHPCKPTCRCKDDYCRNKHGKCVTKKKKY